MSTCAVIVAWSKYVLGVIAMPVNIFLMSLKTRALAGLLLFDGLIGICISITNSGMEMLEVWAWLNLIVVGLSLSIFIGLKLRRRRAREHSSYNDTDSHSFKSHSERYYKPQVTLDGEIVKSGGERLIADYFHNHDIRYEYEKPAKDSSNRKISKPDFYLPEYDIYVEYWGMVETKNYHKRQQYIKGMQWKKARYHENGLMFISVYPEDLGDLGSIFQKTLKK